ncbi:STARD3 N-terminal-like protein isoform X1 [Gallus gallus]|uniref:STARD3 N-terminal-like protein isoform X1 n=1 Tax=Gallus gallus TaxID=9031 RepID=UPI001F003B13|nr:STARD3 N-terminal-like protein isoform X1 [Gallus gallus]
MGAEDSTTARARRKQQRSTRSARQHLPPPSCAHEGGPPRGRSHTGQSRPPAAGSAPRSSGPAALLGRGRIFSGRSDAPGVKGGIETTLKKEVLHYDYSSSYFDIFLLAVFRFKVLILAYAMCRLRHWWAIAFTTAVTSAFLLAKVIISQLFSQGAFGYVLPIISFILAWIETWFLDFKVLPQEAEEENRFLIAQGASERAALLHPGVLSDGQFYSPPESVAGSDEDSEEKQDSEKPVV